MSAPWMKFYPSDWRADPALRMCSIGARGLWMEMLCVMHEAEPRGSLLVNGRAVSERQLAGLSGCSVDELTALLRELEDAGVFSRTEDGVIFSRRMRRDDEKAERDKANGRTGGNPSLKKEKAGVNPPEKGEDKAQKPEARDQIQEDHTAGASMCARQRSRQDLDDLEAALRAAAAPVLNDASPGLMILSPILSAIAAGCDLEMDVLPAIREVAARPSRGPPRRVRSWEFFTDAIRQAHARRTAALPEVNHDRAHSRPIDRSAARPDPFSARMAEIVARQSGHVGPEAPEDPGAFCADGGSAAGPGRNVVQLALLAGGGRPG